jgi:hypothetical protein
MAKKDEAASGTVAVEKIRRGRKPKEVDAETEAIRACTESLRPLTAAARERVLGYVQSRLAEAAA